MKFFTIYTDGAARGNPGPSGAGWVILNEKGHLVGENRKYLGTMTNNQAEYSALLLALADVQKLGAVGEIDLNLLADSELMVRQLKGEYKVKNNGLKLLFQQAVLTLAEFHQFSVKYIPREENIEADRLANEALDERVL